MCGVRMQSFIVINLLRFPLPFVSGLDTSPPTSLYLHMSRPDEANSAVPVTGESDGPPRYTAMPSGAAIESFPDPISAPNAFSDSLILLGNSDLLDVWKHYLAVLSHANTNLYLEDAVTAWVDRMDTFMVSK